MKIEFFILIAIVAGKVLPALVGRTSLLRKRENLGDCDLEEAHKADEI